MEGDPEPEGRRTVLLVEDNEVNQAVEVAILNRRGYQARQRGQRDSCAGRRGTFMA